MELTCESFKKKRSMRQKINKTGVIESTTDITTYYCNYRKEVKTCSTAVFFYLFWVKVPFRIAHNSRAHQSEVRLSAHDFSRFPTHCIFTELLYASETRKRALAWFFKLCSTKTHGTTVASSFNFSIKGCQAKGSQQEHPLSRLRLVHQELAEIVHGQVKCFAFENMF